MLQRVLLGALAVLVSLLPPLATADLTVEELANADENPNDTDYNSYYTSAGDWWTGALSRGPHIVWLAHYGYVVFDPDLENIPLQKGEYYVLVEITPNQEENLYLFEDDRVRRVFDPSIQRMEQGPHIYMLKKCGESGCHFLGRPLLVHHYIIDVNTRR